jgi:hypothetical protein
MLNFESQDEIEVYAGQTGFICFKATDFLGEEHIVKLTIGQFRKVIKNSDVLISEAEENKLDWEASKND